MGRKEARAALESSWTVFEPREAGVPIRKKDLEDLVEDEEREREHPAPPSRADDSFSAIPRQLVTLLHDKFRFTPKVGA